MRRCRVLVIVVSRKMKTRVPVGDVLAVRGKNVDAQLVSGGDGVLRVVAE